MEQMQQELSKRAQQVMELDQLLRAHQAEATAKRLQVERNLAHRQSDLRTRTQEVEDLSQELNEAKKARTIGNWVGGRGMGVASLKEFHNGAEHIIIGA